MLENIYVFLPHADEIGILKATWKKGLEIKSA